MLKLALQTNDPPSNFWDALAHIAEKPNGLYYLLGIGFIIVAARLDVIGKLIQTLLERKKAEIIQQQMVTPITPPLTNGRLQAALELVRNEQKLGAFATVSLITCQEEIRRNEALLRALTDQNKDLENRLAIAEQKLAAYLSNGPILPLP